MQDVLGCYVPPVLDLCSIQVYFLRIHVQVGVKGPTMPSDFEAYAMCLLSAAIHSGLSWKTGRPAPACSPRSTACRGISESAAHGPDALHKALVAADPAAKSLTFWGFSGKPLSFNQKVFSLKIQPNGSQEACTLRGWQRASAVMT